MANRTKMESYQDEPLQNLRKECVHRGIDSKGKKKDLVERLLADDNGELGETIGDDIDSPVIHNDAECAKAVIDMERGRVAKDLYGAGVSEYLHQLMQRASTLDEYNDLVAGPEREIRKLGYVIPGSFRTLKSTFARAFREGIIEEVKRAGKGDKDHQGGQSVARAAISKHVTAKKEAKKVKTLREKVSDESDEMTAGEALTFITAEYPNLNEVDRKRVQKELVKIAVSVRKSIQSLIEETMEDETDDSVERSAPKAANA